VVTTRHRDPHPGHRSVSGGLARAAVFGVSDGLVSNVSLILGFAGSGVDDGVVRLAGLAGAVAGAISMAAGEWISISSQNDLIRRELDVELRELHRNPEHETAELTAVYESHGMAPERARAAPDEVMQQPETALGRQIGVRHRNLRQAGSLGLKGRHIFRVNRAANRSLQATMRGDQIGHREKFLSREVQGMSRPNVGRP
jgi:VIT1/CCC1 family predicted Fe2+/Mn2+ transporter